MDLVVSKNMVGGFESEFVFVVTDFALNYSLSRSSSVLMEIPRFFPLLDLMCLNDRLGTIPHTCGTPMLQESIPIDAFDHCSFVGKLHT